ncbi:hypothetical protein PIB30_066445 [Stylosanthes scabra]|uniref:Uncharacterized protein n=1 Tax=Stylosanthes scabra TaxID=79078 RepID=A0ABU6YL23_9FABA|nr:hypothetical protein [Stylosanthes scabra]
MNSKVFKVDNRLGDSSNRFISLQRRDLCQDFRESILILPESILVPSTGISDEGQGRILSTWNGRIRVFCENEFGLLEERLVHPGHYA